MELVGNHEGTIIRLGNFQYVILAIKDEYGFSYVIGIKVILNFIRSNEFNNWTTLALALLYHFFFETSFHCTFYSKKKKRKKNFRKPSIHLYNYNRQKLTDNENNQFIQSL